MLTRVVIYRRHLRHSTPMPSSLRLRAQLSSTQFSNLPPCKTFPSVLLTSLPQDQLILPPRPRRGQCPLLQKTRVGGRAGAIFHLTAPFDPACHLPYHSSKFRIP